MSKNTTILPKERIDRCIYLVRGQKVLLSHDLAMLYDVEHRTLNQAVRRNISRFPADFMFQLSMEEVSILKSQIVISSWGGARSRPYAFTEQGVAMLSSVLNSERAVQVNIEIMRAFVRLREFLTTHSELKGKLESLEKKYDQQFKVVFDAIRELMKPPSKSTRRIGFKISDQGQNERG